MHVPLIGYDSVVVKVHESFTKSVVSVFTIIISDIMTLLLNLYSSPGIIKMKFWHAVIQ